MGFDLLLASVFAVPFSSAALKYVLVFGGECGICGNFFHTKEIIPLSTLLYSHLLSF